MKKILLVDDTKVYLNLFQVLLAGRGLEFLTAATGAEGLEQARTHRPDLIVSDAKMAGIDGFQLCAAIRGTKELAATPFVLVTSLSDEASRQKGQLVGASGFLSKPVKTLALRALVASLLQVQF